MTPHIFKPGDQVVRIPEHRLPYFDKVGVLPDESEFGFVTSLTGDGQAHVRYWVRPGVLRTVVNSEMTPLSTLRPCGEYVRQTRIDELMYELGYVPSSPLPI